MSIQVVIAKQYWHYSTAIKQYSVYKLKCQILMKCAPNEKNGSENDNLEKCL